MAVDDDEAEVAVVVEEFIADAGEIDDVLALERDAWPEARVNEAIAAGAVERAEAGEEAPVVVGQASAKSSQRGPSARRRSDAANP